MSLESPRASQAPQAIVTAIRGLACDESKERIRARETLTAIGSPATWYLIQAVYLSDPGTRQEALKVLVGLADQAAADVYVALLDDDDSDCRWMAAEGLAALGEEGLRRALELLIEFPRTDHLRRSLHHVLSNLKDSELSGVVAPVLEAFQGVARGVGVPTAAHEAMDELRGADHARAPRNNSSTR